MRWISHHKMIMSHPDLSGPMAMSYEMYQEANHL